MTKADLAKGTGRPGLFQRLDTAYRSFCQLRDLTPEQVDSFMQSYVIYDLDWQDEKQMVETLGPNYQEKVGECLSNYYRVLNHLCAIGELEKMYIPPIMDSNEGITGNQILYEESIAEELQLPSNPKLLDLGCGRGRVAAHMSLLCGAQVTGINIDADQVASAKAYNEQCHFSNEFVRKDFNELPLPLPDAHFDGFYQIQAFSLCKDIPKLASEVYRVLKPGARISLLDWVSLNAYNPQDPHHRELMRCVKPLIGAVGTPTPESMCRDLESAGFRIIRHNNASIDGLQAPLLEIAKGYFGTAKWATFSLVNVGLLPAHFKTLFNRFSQDSDAFIEADRSRLITTCYHWLAEKPRDMDVAGIPKSVSPASSDLAVKADSSASSDSETKATNTPASSIDDVPTNKSAKAEVEKASSSLSSGAITTPKAAVETAA
ncbi:hypothetical protein BAUCODRAFT_61348 [Baudoinia panamericana UAMH 10762]|uniref:Methyltransferase type 11 domain-containing protein n=1 Tax=Baudoinia panamericana (strain UAMH 10762) TaxID=717646 RepID=M2MVL8_BAUPA|nr:uncharacterized protein BAUCODRAFT_61348 [Baudoinia panamericana UAMH 10762]EMD00997.1 hypothetical protein BAUCODRAFT_61348 [Baudoinia panamericana UAMH 10762]